MLPRSDGPARRRAATATLVTALLVAMSLLMSGCNRAQDPSFGEAGGKRTASSAAGGKRSREEIRSMAGSQGEATAPDGGDFKIVYTPTDNPKYAEMNESLRRSGALEPIAEELNAALAIPEDVTITFKECKEINAYWSPPTRTINMCYELVEYFGDVFRANAKSDEELEEMVSGATTFTFFHELGHGLVDILKLPATGKEEDAVDQLSTFVLLTSEGDEGGRSVLNGAQWFWNEFQNTQQAGTSITKLNWADEHSMNGARAFNIICWTYGSAPEKFQGLVNNPLPEARAVRCPTEYYKLSNAWLNLLKPYLKDAGRRALEQQRQLPGGSDQPAGRAEGVAAEDIEE